MDPQNTNNPSGYNRELREDGCPILPLASQDPLASQFNIDRLKTIDAMNTNSCGQGYYIKQDNRACPLGCVECNEENDDFNNENQDMCSSDTDIWQAAQRQANIARRDLSNIWSQMDEVMTSQTPINNIQDDVAIIDNIKAWYTERLSEGQIVKLMLDNKYNNIIDVNEITPDLLNQFKNEVSSTRGSTVSCVEPELLNDELGEEISSRVNLDDNYFTEDQNNVESKNHMIGINQYDPEGIKRWDGCDESSMFGPKNITMNEVSKWSSEQELLDSGRVNIGDGITSNETIYGDVTKGIMGMELFPPNRAFEDCINELLNEYNDYSDSKIISEIRNINNILQLEARHIQFIKKKLELIIISSSKVKVKQCMLDNLVLEDICKMSLSYKMLVVLNILFSTIGFNLELSKVNSDDPNIRKKLIMIIDEMGDLIPRSLDRIIEISEEIELDKCGKVSGRTVLLKELQTVVFNPSKKNINLELPDIKKFISEEYMSDNEFNRFAVIAGIGLAVLKFI